MEKALKLILNGADVRRVCEGAFSELLIEWTERIENLIDAINASGDFEFGNTLHPKYLQFKKEVDDLVAELDKYQVNASDFVKQTLQQNPNVTFVELLELLLKKFL